MNNAEDVGTSSLLPVYLIIPPSSDIGGGGGKRRTVNVAVMLFDKWVAVAAWVAVIVVVPISTIVTVDPLTVATAGLLLL